MPRFSLPGRYCEISFNLQRVHCVSYNRHMGEVKETQIDVAAARKSIANAQERGTWPTPEKVSTPPVPLFVENVPQNPSKRTFEQSRALFRDILKNPIRSHEEAMSLFHKAQKPPQTEQTSTPVITEKKNSST